MRFLIFILANVGLIGCSSSSSREDVDYQVYQCKRLCANGSIDAHRIKGLDCVCNNRQPASQPIIINNNLGRAQNPVEKVIERHHYQESVRTETRSPQSEPELQVKDNATVYKQPGKRTIYSQTKY